MRNFFCLLMLVTLVTPVRLVTPAGAQERAVPTEFAANLPAQRIGANDLLALSVYGAPELTRTVRVGSDGKIRLPMVKRRIDALGKLPVDLEEAIAAALEEEQILVQPIVTVTVAEYFSRPISVAGAVRHPLTFQASGRTTLLEAMSRAEGLSPEAGRVIVITRPGVAPGDAPRIQRIEIKGLIDRADPALNFPLEGGEEIRVPAAGTVFIVGNVKKPGSLKLEDPYGMTVLKALAMSEGLAPYAAKEAFLIRQTTGGKEEIPIELRKILDRKLPDLPLQENDIFYIPDNRKQRATMMAIDRAIGFASSTASGILIYSHP
jgi:polysaccharide export outer membrane protein